MEDRFGADSVWEIGRQSIFPTGAFAAAPAEMAACLKLAGVTGAVDLLDLPCGPGRHSLPLARVGHRVVAVDRTPPDQDELRARERWIAAQQAYEQRLDRVKITLGLPIEPRPTWTSSGRGRAMTT